MPADISAFTPDQQFEIARLEIEATHCENMARLGSSADPLGKLGELLSVLGLSDEDARTLVLDTFFPKKRKSTAEIYIEMLPHLVEVVKAYQSMFASHAAPSEPTYASSETIPVDTCATVLLALLAKHDSTTLEEAQQKAEDTFCKLRVSWGAYELEELAKLLLA